MSVRPIAAADAMARLAEFDAVIDARSEAEYAEDHLPEAINWPSLDNAQRHEVGTMYKQVSPFEARKRGAALEIAFTGSPDVRAMPAEVRLSIGCAEVRDDAADVMSLVKVADGRMYENKRQAAS